MLRYTAVFLVIALVAALFGFTSIAAGATDTAKALFVLFMTLAGLSLISALVRSKHAQ